MKKLQLKVSQEDIQWGKRSDSKECPIVRALWQRDFPRAKVEGGRWSPSGTDPYFNLPENAILFVAAFDLGLDVVPASFSLTYHLDWVGKKNGYNCPKGLQKETSSYPS